MNSSFTLWYEKANESESIPSVEIHLNLWINDDKQDDSIDIGFMIKDPKLIKELYLYVPFNVIATDINNLIKVLSVDKEISSLVFNEDIEFGRIRGEVQDVTRGDKDFQYYLIDCAVLNTLDDITLNGGRILKFIFDENINDKDTYIRFRISNLKDKGIVEYYQKTVSSISGTYNTLTSIEINFNEFRKLPSNIYQKAYHKHIKISLVNLFIMTDIHMEYIFSNIDNVKSRILEKEKWIKYNEKLEENKSDKILAYQFKEKPKEDIEFLNEFSIFSKFNNEGAKTLSIVIALFVALVLGIVGSITASFISNDCPKKERGNK